MRSSHRKRPVRLPRLERLISPIEAEPPAAASPGAQEQATSRPVVAVARAATNTPPARLRRVFFVGFSLDWGEDIGVNRGVPRLFGARAADIAGPRDTSDGLVERPNGRQTERICRMVHKELDMTEAILIALLTPCSSRALRPARPRDPRDSALACGGEGR